MKTFKNYLFSSSYQLLLVIVPIITIPYLSRVLGTDGIGLNTFTASVAGYYVLIATLGTNLYGNREIAYCQNDKEKRSKIFWEITLLSWSSSLITLMFYVTFIIFIDQYRSLYLLQGIAILTTMFDISWYFMGVEKFKIPVIRNFIVKFITVISIFTFVNDPSDLYKYVLILMLGGFIGSLTLWPYLRNEINHPNFKEINVLNHLKPSLLLFFPYIYLNIYTYGQKTMLGLLDSINSVGLFFQSDTLIKVVLSLITSIGTVMLPRMSGLKSTGDLNGIKNSIKKNFNLVIGISSAFCFGIAAISINFAPFFFGEQFKSVGNILMVESFSLFFMAFSNILQTHYYLPMNKLKQLNFSMLLGAISNILLNLLLIPLFGVIGSAFSVVITELLMVSCQYYYMTKEFKYDNFFENIWKYLVSGITMFVVVFSMNISLKMNTINLILQVAIGALIYVFMNILLKTKLWEILSKLIHKIKSK